MHEQTLQDDAGYDDAGYDDAGYDDAVQMLFHKKTPLKQYR